MTGQQNAGTQDAAGLPLPTDQVTLTIDGTEVTVAKGTLVIRAAEQMGIEIPRFCDHPLLEPVGACRQCLVDVEGQRKPLTSCTTTVTEGMVVRTQHTSPVADKAQHGVMEFLLINHPLDCPMCDKGGECPLQNQAMAHGRPETRFEGVKRTFPKPLNISAQILLDRERCVLCARCTRFSEQISGDPFIEMLERGALQQVGIYAKEPFESYFSGNTIQICPVGALTSADYRFRARPFDLVSSPSMCEHCASGCAQRTDHRRGKVMRRLAGEEPLVNEEWNCDKGRFAFTYATERDRLATPLVRGADGVLAPASWPHALAVAARGLAQAQAGVLVGGRSTWEDAYAYGKFARLALGTNDIDFRARAHSAEETRFLASSVAGRRFEVTYENLAAAPAVLLVGLEPEEESPIVYLRLRKTARTKGLKVYSVAAFATQGLTKMSGTLLASAPGGEAAVVNSLGGDSAPGAALRAPGAIILVGERAALMPGALSAAARLAADTGAKLGWVPRRAGDRGALEAGALPNLLPGGRPVADAEARGQAATMWNAPTLPESTGRDTTQMLAAARAGELTALVIGGVELEDLPDPEAAREAVRAAAFTVSLELRHSSVTDLADVVFPVAPVVSKAGTFLDWEGRRRPFEEAIAVPGAMADMRVLDLLAQEMGVALELPNLAAAREQLAGLAAWDGARPTPPQVEPATPTLPARGQALLASFRMLLDAGRLQDGERHLAATARTPVVRLSQSTAAEIGVADGDLVTVASARGAITLPLVLTDLPDRVVWLPMNSPGASVCQELAVEPGAVVDISPARTAVAEEPQ
ncbi:NADH-quinone oxidoreductase subunit G [Tomitella biformata]|uniref:NADH-quinone oxidoreductase subunit G n=1 Tax=Tomitella biformata TaxID=630403 RepID=UPI0004669170|nr:NADH-quinone oxidoreductase subunit G [Tomitella biformata]